MGMLFEGELDEELISEWACGVFDITKERALKYIAENPSSEYINELNYFASGEWEKDLFE
jgi:hypothetical protein